MPRFKLIDGSIVTVSDSEVDEFLTKNPGAQKIDGRESVRNQVRQDELAQQNLKEQELERTAVEDLNKARERETYPQFEEKRKLATKRRFDKGYFNEGEEAAYTAYKKTGDILLTEDKQTLQELYQAEQDVREREFMDDLPDSVRKRVLDRLQKEDPTNASINAFQRNYNATAQINNTLANAAVDLGLGTMYLLDMARPEKGGFEEKRLNKKLKEAEAGDFFADDRGFKFKNKEEAVSYYKDKLDNLGATPEIIKNLISKKEKLEKERAEKLPKPIPLENINSLAALGDYTSDAIVNFLPSGLALMLGPAALPAFGIMGATGKLSQFAMEEGEAEEYLPELEKALKNPALAEYHKEIKAEIERYNKILSTNNLTKLGTSALYAGSEMLFERFTTLKLFNDLKQAAKLKPPYKEGIGKAILKVPEASAREGVGEGLTQITQNASDILIEDKNISLLDNVDEAAVQGGLIGTGFGVATTSMMARAHIFDVIASKKDKQNIANGLETIQNLNNDLQNPEISKERKIQIKNLINKKTKELSLNEDIISDRFLKLSGEQQKEVFELDRKSREINKQWINIASDPTMSESTKDIMEQDLRTEFDNLQQTKRDIIQSADNIYNEITKIEGLEKGDEIRGARIANVNLRNVKQHNKGTGWAKKVIGVTGKDLENINNFLKSEETLLTLQDKSVITKEEANEIINNSYTINENGFDGIDGFFSRESKNAVIFTDVAGTTNPAAAIHEYMHAAFVANGITKKQFDNVKNDLTELIKNKAGGQITQKQADNILAKVETYTENQSEELFTAISDFVNADVIRESDGDFLSKLRNTLKGAISNLVGVSEANEFKIDTAEDAFNFIKGFNRKVVKGTGIEGRVSTEPTKEEGVAASNITNLYNKYGENKRTMVEQSFTKTPSGQETFVPSESEFGQSIGGLLESITKRIYDPIPEDLKKGQTRTEFKNDLVSEAATIIDREYDPEKQDIGKFITNRLNLRANRLEKDLGVKQKIETDVSEAKGVATEEVTPKIQQTKKIAERLGISNNIIDKAKDALEIGILNAENKLEGTEKLSGKKRIAIRDKAVNDIIDRKLYRDIQDEFGRNTDTSKSFTDYLSKNFSALRDAALKHINFQKGTGAAVNWNTTPPTEQEFIDYYLAADQKKSTRSDRKRKLAKAVGLEISEQVRKEYVKTKPEEAKKFQKKTGLVLGSNIMNWGKSQNIKKPRIPLDFTKKIMPVLDAISKANINPKKDGDQPAIDIINKQTKNKNLREFALQQYKDNFIKGKRYGGIIVENVWINFLKSQKVNVIDGGAGYNSNMPDIQINLSNGKILVEVKQDSKAIMGQQTVQIKDGKVTAKEGPTQKRIESYFQSLVDNGTIPSFLDEVNKLEGLKENDEKYIKTFPFKTFIKESTNKKIKELLKTDKFKAIAAPFKFDPTITKLHYLSKLPKDENDIPYYIQINDIGMLSLNGDLSNFNVPEFDINIITNFRFKQSDSKIDEKTGEKKRSYSFSAEYLLDPKSVKDFIKNNKNIKPLSDESIINKIKASKIVGLNTQFNRILEKVKGVPTREKFSEARAAKLGKKNNPYKFFVPYSAEDYMGLIYPTLGKGKIGDENLEWYKKNIITPYAKGIRDFETAKEQALNSWEVLKKQIKNVPEKLEKEAIDGFSNEDAIRIYLWNKQGTIPSTEGKPDINKKEIAAINRYIKSKPNLLQFANQIKMLTPEGYPEASGTDWLAGTITTDLINYTNTVSRAQYLQEWQDRVDVVYSKDNMNKLKAIYGEDYTIALADMLHRMKTGRNRPSGANKLTNQYLNWVNNSVGTIMFFNTRSALLQTISSVNYLNWSDNNALKVAEAFANQPQFWKDFGEIFNSDFLKSRRGGLKTDVNADEIARAAQTSKNKFKAGLSYLLKKGFIPTQYADSFAISFGGATFYRNRTKSLMKEGLSEKAAKEQAFLDFKEITEESQQSSRPDRVSMQQASPLGRLILSFANTPMQYTRLTKRAALDLINGRGDWKTNVSKLAYYGAVQNIIFTALQSALFALAFSDEEDEKEKARYVRIANGTFDTLLRGAGVHGAAVAAAKNIVLEVINQAGGKQEFDKAALEITSLSPPIDSKISKLMSAGRSFKFKQEREKMVNMPIYDINNPALMAGAQALSVGINLPLDRALRKAQNLKLSVDKDTELWQSIALALGYSKWDLNMKDSYESETKTKTKKPSRVDLVNAPLKKIQNLPKGVLGKAHKDGTIQIRKGLSAKKRAEVIKHEKQHVKDMNSGRLDYDQCYVYWEGKKYPRVSGKKIVFNGKALPEGHGSFPWERAANKAV